MVHIKTRVHSENHELQHLTNEAEVAFRGIFPDCSELVVHLVGLWICTGGSSAVICVPNLKIEL